jgi:V8-like Glu-specific endopeptidase
MTARACTVQAAREKRSYAAIRRSPFADDECKGDMYYDLDYLESSDYRSGGRDDESLAYDLDAQPGHSGRPIYRTTNNAILAVHWGGWSDVDERYFGARFRSSMYNDVCNWIAAVGSTYETHPNCF